MVQNELDRVARIQRKAEEDDLENRLQALKSKVAAEEQNLEAEKQKTRSLCIFIINDYKPSMAGFGHNVMESSNY